MTKLYETTHWRKLRSIYTRICRHESIDANKYDLEHITCYSVHSGDELLGNHVVSRTGNGGFPFVYDNKYDIYEAPLKGQRRKFRFMGDFLVLAHDKSFDYWLLIKMTHTFVAEFEHVTYIPCGKYVISSNRDELNIEKTEYGRNIYYGGRVHRNTNFDAFGTRKHAYHYKSSDVLSLRDGYKNRTNTIKGGQKVKKYKR